MQLTKAQLADLLDVTPRTLTTWQSEPDFPAPERHGRTNRYDGRACVQWWRAREIGRLIDGEDGELMDLNQERARLARAQTQRQMLLLSRERGEVALVADVCEAVSAQFSNVRAHLLALPGKVAPLVHAAESPQEARTIIETAVHQALTELSSEKFDAAGGAPAD